MDITQLDKPSWKPKFVSEFSMGMYDFERYNEWLKKAEKFSAEINSTDCPSLEMIQNYFACLNILWKCWRPIVAFPHIVEGMDKIVAESRALKRYWEDSKKSNIPVSVYKIRQITDKMDTIHTILMEIKQIIGLGIVVKKNLNVKEKIKVGMNRKKYDELPEP